MSSIVDEARKSNSRIFRRAFIKRRLASTGLFESSWQDISKDVKRWGKISRSIDSVRYGQFRFGELQMLVANDYGKYNPHTDEGSIWYGYAHQQRTLLKVETGFVHQTLGANNIWTNTEYPSTTTTFVGVISGDMLVSDDNDVNLPVKPLIDVFRNFPARNLTGLTSTGVTASQFITLLRDQTDGSSNYIFRPFFQDTTTYWDYTSSSNVYSNLNTNTAAEIRDMNVWEVIEKLAEAEDLVTYITRDGVFKFKNREPNTSASQFSFFGRGFADTNYGNTIKKVSSYGTKLTNFYSRVEVKFVDSDTWTSSRVQESALSVNGTNTAWNLGHRTYRFENFWIPDTTTADSILTNIFSNTASLKTEIEFTTSYVPHLEVLDRVNISFDTTERRPTSLWDTANWADESITSIEDLFWDPAVSDAIRLDGVQFKLLDVDINLDNLECRFKGRQV